MDYSVRHHTTYRYLQEVSHSMHLLHLAPRATDRQRVVETTIVVTPEPSTRVRRRDAFGNPTEWLTLDEPHVTLDIDARSWVVAAPAPLRDPRRSLPWGDVRSLLEAPQSAEEVEAIGFLFDSPLVRFSADLAGYAAASFPAGRPAMEGAVDLMRRIHADFRYDTTVTDATTPVDRVFEIRAGVCQDLALVAIACLRAIGLPARYVSGDLLTEPPPGQSRLLGADASHAWFAAWCPPFGWVELDPTNDLLPGEGHVTVAWGRDYGDVAPISGVVVGGGDHTIDVGVDVIPDMTLGGPASVRA
ncbi:MAG: transglutaminase N-terminal domain-containing protein [Alphaproteobacteria bacterium]